MEVRFGRQHGYVQCKLHYTIMSCDTLCLQHGFERCSHFCALLIGSDPSTFLHQSSCKQEQPKSNLIELLCGIFGNSTEHDFHVQPIVFVPECVVLG